MVAYRDHYEVTDYFISVRKKPKYMKDYLNPIEVKEKLISMNMNTVQIKVISTAAIFVVTFLGGYVPFVFLRRFVKDQGTEDKLSLLRCLAGGIFLGTCLVHLLPEAQEAMATAFGDVNYPAAEACIGIGFLVMYTTENLMMTCHSHSSHDVETTVKFTRGDNVKVNRTLESESEKSLIQRYGSVESDTDFITSNGDKDENDDVFKSDIDPLLESSSNVVLKIDKPTTVEEEPHSTSPSFRSFVLLIALSLHTVFDGLVIGIQDSATLIWTLLVVMCIHKALVAFSLGLSFLDSHARKPRSALLYLLFFSSVAPIGTGIGTALTESSFSTQNRAYVEGFLQSLATGTFMFVTFCECLKDELLGKPHVIKTLCVIVGFGLVAGLRFAIHED